MTNFEPKILALCCHYCAYAAADLAGSMRIQYPPNVRVLRLPCTGKVDSAYLIKAFERGVDGVIVAGCLEGGCHFQEGNLRARKRVDLVRELMEEIGLESARLEMYNLSSAMGQAFADIVKEMTDRIRELGPNPLKRYMVRQESEHVSDRDIQDEQDKTLTGNTGQEHFSHG